MDIPLDRYIDVNSIKTCYWEVGEGYPLILLHGLGGSVAGYLPCINDLKVQHRVIALDMVGHGRTEGSALELESADDLARFVVDFMDALQIEKANFLGHSMGGLITLAVIRSYPERVSNLILSDASGLGREITPLFRVLTTPLIGEILGKITYMPDYESFSKSKRKMFQNTKAISEELIAQLFQRENKAGSYKSILKFLRTGCNWFGQKEEFIRPIIESLPDITIPVLIIWGDKDDVVPWQHGRFASSVIPNSRFELIENCGHVPMFDQPEIFSKLVLGFL